MASMGVTNFSNNLWISASGLSDASIRIATVAHNVANMNTNGFEPDRVQSSALAGGGVTTTIERVSISETSRESVLSNTDIATEMTNLIAAKRAYQASAIALCRTNDAVDSVFTLDEK